MKYKHSLILILIGCTIHIATWAFNVKNLDIALVPVANQSSTAFNQALPIALHQVLVKYTGNLNATLPSNAISDFEQIIVSYRYQLRKNIDNSSQLYLQVQFNSQAIRSLLQQTGQALWPANRPLTLLWLAVNDGQKNGVISTSDNTYGFDVMENANLRGIPIILPAMDIHDYTLANSNQPLNANDLIAIGSRYQVHSVFAGNVALNNGQWQGQWSYLLNGQVSQWTNTAGSADNVIADGINTMISFMLNHYNKTDNNNQQARLQMQITGINSLTDYVNVLHYLKEQPPITTVGVANTQGESLTINVTVHGGKPALTKALQYSHHLQAIDTNNLAYQWHSQPATFAQSNP